jgi:hypothetical protein
MYAASRAATAALLRRPVLRRIPLWRALSAGTSPVDAAAAPAAAAPAVEPVAITGQGACGAWRAARAAGGGRTSRGPAASASCAAERHVFQAETKQLLDIVTHALYTDKHIFIRCVRGPPGACARPHPLLASALARAAS